MIAHIHALAVSAAAAFGPQVLGDTLTLLDGEQDEEAYGLFPPLMGQGGLTPAAEMWNGRLAMLGTRCMFIACAPRTLPLAREAAGSGRFPLVMRSARGCCPRVGGRAPASPAHRLTPRRLSSQASLPSSRPRLSRASTSSTSSTSAPAACSRPSPKRAVRSSGWVGGIAGFPDVLLGLDLPDRNNGGVRRFAQVQFSLLVRNPMHIGLTRIRSHTIVEKGEWSV